ncbi:hypothetical protein EDB80DRAFT_314534 [Ilyonectria destructans]|nr:hypothetical protein EDB80DRAFT_314534 [Ilyonectria destructans]
MPRQPHTHPEQDLRPRRSRSRSRSPSPSDQLIPSKRRRVEREADLPSPSHLSSPPRPSSRSTIASSISPFYGIGDDNALDNLFASYPQRFSDVPRPHGQRGMNESTWSMRNDHEIYFNTDLILVSSSVRRVTELIPGEYPYSLSSSSSPTPSSPPSSTSSIQGPPQATKAEFQSALKLVQEVIGKVGALHSTSPVNMGLVAT